MSSGSPAAIGSARRRRRTAGEAVELVDRLDQLALVVEVAGDEGEAESALARAAPRATLDEAAAQDRAVGAQRRREAIDPVVDHEQGTVRLSPIACAPEGARLRRPQRGVLDEREPVVVPWVLPAGRALGEHDDASVGPDQLAQGG